MLLIVSAGYSKNKIFPLNFDIILQNNLIKNEIFNIFDILAKTENVFNN